MKKFREFLNEDSPSLSPTDEARRRLEIERSVMGIPQDQVPQSKNLKELQRHRDQVEYENSQKFPEQTLEKFADEDLKQSALDRANTLNDIKKAANDYLGGPSILMQPLSWAENQMTSRAKEANKRLQSNPTYKYSNTGDINKKETP